MISGTLAIVAVVGVVLCLLIQPISILVVALGLGVVLFSDSSSELGPEETVRQFITALSEGDEIKVLDLGTDAMDEVIGPILSSFMNADENTFLTLMEQVRSIECRETGAASAICSICIQQQTDCQDIGLIREEGRWLVHVSKETEN